MSIDVARARRDTPGCADLVHLNNAGSALPPAVVTDAVVDFLQREARIGGYEAAAEAADRIEHTYDAIAALIGCDPSEIAVVENATVAWDMAFYSFTFKPGDRILTARSEYASNVIAYLQVANRTGATVEVVDDDEHGQLSVEDLRRRMDDDVKLVTMSHVPTQGGLVNPAAEVGQVTRAAGVPFLLDACQSVGQLEIDVEAIGCDLLSATGRKYLRGPRGTGFLYASQRILEQLEPPVLDMRSATWTSPDTYRIRPDARRFENWESNYALKVGLGVAVDYALELGIAAIEERVVHLAEQLRADLSTVPGVQVHDRGVRKSGIVSFTVDGVPADEVKKQLSQAKINTSVIYVESAQYDLARRNLPEVVRASVHYYNTEGELARTVDTVAALR